MPVPTRPSTGGPIESSWGQETHDGVFTPAGGKWVHPSANVPGQSYPLNALDDPSGWLLGGDGTPTLTVPADGGGLYLVTVQTYVFINPNINFYVAVALNGSIAPVDGAIAGTMSMSIAATYYQSLSGQMELVPGDTLLINGTWSDLGSYSTTHYVRIARIGWTVGLA